MRVVKEALHFPKLYIHQTKEKGRGVFAGRRIRAGEVIERCPVLPLTQAEERKAQSMVLRDYIFAWGARWETSCIALGFGAMYNHSDHPNAWFRQRRKQKQIEFIALRDIKKGEEILTDYEWDEEEYQRCGIRRATGRNGTKKPMVRET